MSTEILGFFIILGALVLVLLRRNDWLKLITGETQQSRLDDVEEASAKLRYELQHSADQIIERMGSHIDRLERLIVEADRRSGELEEQLRFKPVRRYRFKGFNDPDAVPLEHIHQMIQTAGKFTGPG